MTVCHSAFSKVPYSVQIISHYSVHAGSLNHRHHVAFPGDIDLRRKREALKTPVDVQLEKAAEMLNLNKTATPATGIE